MLIYRAKFRSSLYPDCFVTFSKLVRLIHLHLDLVFGAVIETFESPLVIKVSIASGCDDSCGKLLPPDVMSIFMDFIQSVLSFLHESLLPPVDLRRWHLVELIFS